MPIIVKVKKSSKKTSSRFTKNDQLPFPKRIDDEFKYLAKIKKEQFPFKYWIENPKKNI